MATAVVENCRLPLKKPGSNKGRVKRERKRLTSRRWRTESRELKKSEKGD